MFSQIIFVILEIGIIIFKNWMNIKMNQIELKYANDLKEILYKNQTIMQILKTLKRLEPHAYIAAGIIRNTVWAHLHDQVYLLENTEVDVIFYDEKNYLNDAEKLQQEMTKIFPNMQWDITNQALVHTWYKTDTGESIAPLTSIEHALSLWPETATSVAVRLNDLNEIVYVAPFGLADLFELKLRWNKTLVSHQVFLDRLKAKNFLGKWSKLELID